MKFGKIILRYAHFKFDEKNSDYRSKYPLLGHFDPKIGAVVTFNGRILILDMF